jgi:hypothetical protein
MQFVARSAIKQQSLQVSVTGDVIVAFLRPPDAAL